MRKTYIMLLFSILTSALFVSCKQKTVKTEEKEFTKKYYLSADTTKGALTLDIHVEIPVGFANKNVLDSIRKTIISSAFGAEFVKFSNDSIVPLFAEMLHKEYKNNNGPLVNELDSASAYSFNNEHTVEGFSLLSDKIIYTYGIDRYVYMGGAHGLGTRSYFNFDLTTGKIIKETDLFKKDFKKSLTELIKKRIIEDSKENQESNSRAIVDLDDTDFWTDSIKPNGNFYITDESINYVFNPYEIAPYYMGQTEVVLPFNLIKDLLKPNNIIAYLIEKTKEIVQSYPLQLQLMNTFFDLLKTRRSIRKFQPQAVEPEKIELITKSVLMSPASKRSNPWEFIVVQDPDMLQKLADCRPHGSQLIANAPLGIVVIADTTKSDVWIEDASIAAIIMQLQAQDLGLGSCWVQVWGRLKEEGITAENYICELLNIPANYAVLNVVAIGYPNEERKPYDEEKLPLDKIHNEQFE